MEENQIMLEKLINELKLLEDSFNEIEKRKEEVAKEYNVIKDKVLKLKDEIINLKHQRDKLPESENAKISYVIVMTMILFSGFLVAILVVLFSFTSSIQSVVFSVLSMFAIFILIRVFGVKGLRKLQHILYKKAYDNYTNSDKYKELLGKIEGLEKELDKSLDEEMVKEVNKRIADAEYNSCIAEISIKKSLIDYIEKEINSPVEQKNYVRRRIKLNEDDLKNIRNIE